MASIVGGDLYHLWRVSEVHLPRVADAYYDAGRAIGEARAYDADAFRSDMPSYPGATSASYSPVGRAWAQLCDELQRMYAQIGGTCLAAAEGLRRARQAFVDADLANADALSDYLADPTNHDPDDPSSNPPAPGSADDPGTPDLPTTS